MNNNIIFSEVTRRYARALFSVALDNNQQDTVESDVNHLQQLIMDNEDLRNFLANPIIKRNKQKDVINAILAKASYSKTVQNFVKLVADKGRLSLLHSIIGAYGQELAAMRNEKTAYITSANSLSATLQKDIEQKLQVGLGKVQCIFNTDSSLIGGMVIRVGSIMLDTSYKAHLQQLSSQMKGF